MANTYTQLYVQIVFTVKGKHNFIAERNRVELEKYICGIISAMQCKPLSIYCNPDHIHILIGLNPITAISALARDIKANSSRFINDKKWFAGRFEWQSGFGAFSYSKSQMSRVSNYILNQAEHHKKATFRKEYMQLLNNFEIDYDERYLFEFYDNSFHTTGS